MDGENEEKALLDGVGAKRGRVELCGDILEAIDVAIRNHENVRLSRVQGVVNMSYARFRTLVANMVDWKFVSVEKERGHYGVRLERKGLDYLHHYKLMRNSLNNQTE